VEPPYHPAERFPELGFDETAATPNAPYALLRQLFGELGLDAARTGTECWNPLGDIVAPGQTVLLKPNFVLGFNAGGGGPEPVITHPSILRALVDYVYLALGGVGRIVIADAPQMDCDWPQLMAFQRLDAIQDFYRAKFGFHLEVLDLRNFALERPLEAPLPTNRQALRGDPLGSAIVNLGRRSHFYGLESKNYYGADFDREETIRHHRGDIHEYSVSRTVLSADVFISVPKLKVHKKVGVTLNLKGLVGINTSKNYLVHYRVGTPRQGGDQLPDSQPGFDRALVRIQRFLYDALLAKKGVVGTRLYQFALGLYRIFIRPFRHVSASTILQDGGNWHGNDSAWRMTADLAKILYFCDKEGVIRDEPQRKIFCVVDGIVGGENNGPLSPDAKLAGTLVIGSNPLAVDLVASRLMGFDPAKIRQFSILDDARFDFGMKGVADIEVIARDSEVRRLFQSGSRFLDFRPHPGWIGRLEIGGSASSD
jgi:uncharacterized protein (DUF362 family)